MNASGWTEGNKCTMSLVAMSVRGRCNMYYTHPPNNTHVVQAVQFSVCIKWFRNVKGRKNYRVNIREEVKHKHCALYVSQTNHMVLDSIDLDVSIHY